MDLKIGDIVAVIDDPVKGRVVKIESSTIFIEDEEGFLFNYEISQLIRVDVEQSELLKSNVSDSYYLSQNSIEKNNKKIVRKGKKRKDDQPIFEVDLHIEKLLKSYKGLSNYEILNIQLDTAKRQLEFAIRKRIPRVVFIHGVGEGVLQSELSYLLKRYNVDFSEASYQKYGQGATEVYIYQNK